MADERLREIRAEHEMSRGASWMGDYPFDDIEYLLELIGPEYHVLETTDADWFLRHPVECRDIGLNCAVHAAVMETFEPLGPPGKWKIELVGGRLELAPLG